MSDRGVLPGRSTLQRARRKVDDRDPVWPEQLTVLVAILLSLALPDQLTVGPTWLLPALEGALFILLVASTPPSRARERQRRRSLRIALVSLLSAANVASLFLLAHFGVQARNPNGRSLLIGGGVLWLTAVLLFALWYWEIDRGGPVRRASHTDRCPDFVFPQMQVEQWTPPEWEPEFPDYLYLALINGATFAPPESSFALTHRARLAMGLQSVAALATVTLVLARAVNVLG